MNLRNELQNLISNIDQKDLQKIYEYALSSIKTCTSEEEESVTILCCPHCGSVSIKRNGTYDRKQRFICKDCKKSFSTTTNTFFFHNRISKEVWKKFIDYEMDSLTLKSIAYYLDISVHTAFRMRHKLYRAVSSIVEKQKCFLMSAYANSLYILKFGSFIRYFSITFTSCCIAACSSV